METNYHAVLGVEEDASQAVIEGAYRARLREMAAGYDVSWPLALIQEAFAALSEASHRQTPDASFHKVPIPADPGRGGSAAEPLIPTKRPAQLGDVSLSESFRTFSPSFEEIHDRWWSNFSSATRPKAEETRSLAIEIPITPEQATTGATARVLVPALSQCDVCQGHGGVGQFACVNCLGRGSVAVEHPVTVSFPAGRASHVVEIPLDHLGIHNFYLTVHFRMTHVSIE
jgi:molecular chaperone DnaJ